MTTVRIHPVIPRLLASLVLGAGLCGVLASPRAVGETFESVAPTPFIPGRTDFDVVDRLAILNLFASVIHGIDQQRIELIAPAIAPAFEAEFHVPGNPIQSISGREAFIEMITGRFSNYAALGMQRRHLATMPFIIEQTPDSARGIIHFQIISILHGGNWHPIASGIVEHEAIKRDGVWLFVSQREFLDAPLDMPLKTIVPIPETASETGAK